MIAARMVNEWLTPNPYQERKPLRNRWKEKLSFAFRKKSPSLSGQILPASVNFNP
jgi:hypothetical protein